MTDTPDPQERFFKLLEKEIDGNKQDHGSILTEIAGLRQEFNDWKLNQANNCSEHRIGFAEQIVALQKDIKHKGSIWGGIAGSIPAAIVLLITLLSK